MANSAVITRRAALLGAAASSAALAVPAVAALPLGETPHRKVRRLQKELADALAEVKADPTGFDYVAITLPAGEHFNCFLMDRHVYDSERSQFARYHALDIEIRDWKRARDEFVRVQARYDAICVEATVGGVYHPLPSDHPIKAEWFNANYAETQASRKLLNLLSVEGV